MPKVLIIAAAVILLAAGGAMEIVRSGKTASESQIRSAQEKLASIPMKIGEWEGIDQEPRLKELEQARADGYLNRAYVRKATKHAVTVLIMVGDPKEMGAHDPKVCYLSAGYSQKGQEKSVKPVAGRADSLWSVNFEGELVSPAKLNVMWAWTANGTWDASTRPRVDYATEPLLYKVYVSRELTRDEKQDGDPSHDLLKELLPEIQKALAPAK